MILHPRRKPGFTLLELLVVMAIIAIMAGISLPLVTALTKSGQFNQTLTELTGTLELARQYAVSQNTYVWVAFAAPDPAVPYQLDVAVLASADGTEIVIPGTGSPVGPSTWGGNLLAGSTLNLVAKMRTFPLTNLAKAGTVTAVPAPAIAGTDLASNASFSLVLPGKSTATLFTQALEFTPSGEARVAPGTPVSLIEFDLQPDKGPGVVDAKNGAVVQINGLTGAVRLYRQ